MLHVLLISVTPCHLQHFSCSFRQNSLITSWKPVSFCCTFILNFFNCTTHLLIGMSLFLKYLCPITLKTVHCYNLLHNDIMAINPFISFQFIKGKHWLSHYMSWPAHVCVQSYRSLVVYHKNISGSTVVVTGLNVFQACSVYVRHVHIQGSHVPDGCHQYVLQHSKSHDVGHTRVMTHIFGN